MFERRRPAGFVGDVYETGSEERDFTNANPQSPQITTLTVTTPVLAEEVFVDIDGHKIVYKMGSVVAATEAAALADALSADILVYGKFEVSHNAAVVTLTARQPMASHNVSSGPEGSVTTTDLVASTTAATPAAEIPFGRLVIRDTSGGGEKRLGRLPSSAGDVTDVAKPFGISIRKLDEPGGAYAPNSRCAALRRGAILVALATSTLPVDGGVVYVDYATGEFQADSTGNGTALGKDVALFRGYLGNGLAIIDANFN